MGKTWENHWKTMGCFSTIPTLLAGCESMIVSVTPEGRVWLRCTRRTSCGHPGIFHGDKIGYIIEYPGSPGSEKVRPHENP
jgi:hypothetical protein